MSEQTNEQAPPAAPPEAPPAETPEGASRLVPVAESIKYRRRAQQAESRLHEVEQKLTDLQAQLDRRGDELATAEAQRDEARLQVVVAENRLAVERRLLEAGVSDLETACLLLSKRVELTGELDQESLSRGVEQLLLDKPWLRGAAPGGSLPPRTASAKAGGPGPAARLAVAAEQAARTGDRRHVAEYLRLRRQTAR